jgi:hypothetical protein
MAVYSTSCSKKKNRLWTCSEWAKALKISTDAFSQSGYTAVRS